MPTYTFDLENERDGGTDAQAGQDLSMVWHCLCDTATVDAGDVIAALDAQESIAKGSAHPTYGYARCTSIRAVVLPADPFRWKVTAKFLEPRPQPGDEVNPSGGQPDPPDRAPWVTGSFRREDVFRGVDATPSAAGPPATEPRDFVNSAGDRLDDAPPVPLGVGQITVTRYYTSISFAALLAYQNACNAAEWQTFPPHSLCITGITWEPHSERGWSGYKVVFTLEYKAVTPEQQKINPSNLSGAGPFTGPIADMDDGITGGWHPIAVLDLGYKYLDAGTTPTVYDDPEGSGIPKPVPGFLNGIDGQRASDPKYLAFDIHPRISFAILDP